MYWVISWQPKIKMETLKCVDRKIFVRFKFHIHQPQQEALFFKIIISHTAGFNHRLSYRSICRQTAGNQVWERDRKTTGGSESKWVREGEIALVLHFIFRSRSALSPDVKSVSIVLATGGVIGKVSWQQHFSLTLWELARRQRERERGETGVREWGKGGQRGKDGRRKWRGWKNGKGVCDAVGRFGTNKKAMAGHQLWITLN